MVVSADPAAHGEFPAELTTFVGRRSEIADVKRLLTRSRLVTLTGVGGVGKTRLALRVAMDSRRAFPDGTYLVELAELQDPALLAHTLAERVGLRDQSTKLSVLTLAEHLAERHLLLVLDNCEHLVNACADLISTLLRSCRQLHVLATSRQPLNIPAEITYTVFPMTVPDPCVVQSPETILRYDAATLFTERASLVLPSFTMDEETCGAVARLCQRLEGIPLAIELSAARLRALSLEQIERRVDDRFRLLTGGSRVAPRRQQTLHAVVAWSWDLCLPEERLLWARLSVFVGGCELDAVEGICTDEKLPREDVLDLVSSLLEKSVLVREEQDGHVRYRMLETIRQFGLRKLAEAGEDSALRRRHRDWYDRLADDFQAEWIGPDQVRWFARLRREHGNLRVALDYCLAERDEAEVAQRMAAHLERYWVARGLHKEARHWLSRALAAAPEPTVSRAKALRVDVWLSTLQGDFEHVEERLAECRQLADQLGDPLTLAYVAQVAGMAAQFAGDLPRAVSLLEEALAGFREVGFLAGEVYALFAIGMALAMARELERAEERLSECIAITSARGECWFRSFALWILGLSRRWQGDLRRAESLVKDSLRLKRALNDQLGMALCLESLAWIAADQGRDQRAALLLGAADAIWHEMGTSVTRTFAPLSPMRDAAEARARARLGERAYEATHGHGRKMPPEEAFAAALEEPGAPPASVSGDGSRRGGQGPLTKRENEIADLVARGLTNKEIAQRLVISTRTAEGHVENILSKLGFTSRSQIAAWVAEQRPHPG